jgi:hypothetical protein
MFTTLLAGLTSLAVAAMPASASTSLSLEQWSAGYLSYIGVPATGASDPRVVFLEKWAIEEGTFYLGNIHNPLDTEMPEGGNGYWNSAGVRTYPTLDDGYAATLATMDQSFDAPILSALRNRHSTVASLTAALASSNWSGGGPGSANETGYAGAVGGALVSVAGEAGPTPVNGAPAPGSSWNAGTDSWLDAATVRGRVENPLGAALGGVCVSAIPTNGYALTAVTASDGSFRISGLPETDVHLRIVDCHLSAGARGPAYYDGGAAPRFAATNASNATTISLRCGHGGTCSSVRYQVPKPIVFGTVAPEVTWPTPSAISYGNALSQTQLNATTSVRGKFVYSPAIGTVLSAGTHSLSLTFKPRDQRDYQDVTKTVTVSVGKTVPAVSWSTPGAITFGTALGSAELDATAAVPGSFSYRSPNASGSILSGGTHTLVATFEPVDSNNYASVPASTSLVVNQAVPVINVATNPTALPGSALTTSDIGAHTSVSGTFGYSPGLGSTVATGPQSVSVTFTPQNPADYTSNTVAVTLDGNVGTPTVTWATPKPIAAGTALSGTQLDARASVAGTFTYSPAAGTEPAPGTDTLSVTFKPTNTTGYSSVTTTVPLVVNPPVVPIITWATPSAVAAGTALSTTQLDARTSVPGTYTYSPAAGTVPQPGIDTLSVTFTPTNTAAYASATDTVSLVVNAPIVPTITWATPSPVAPGTALSSIQLDAHASVPGTFTYSPAAGAVPAAGTDTLTVTFTPTNTIAYASATDTVALDVT